jgi:hypothetical protein
MQLDAKALAAATADIVRRHVDQATAPLIERIAVLEARKPEKGERGEIGEAGPQGRDGIGMAGALVNRGGELIISLADGSQHNVGTVVGKDGATGPRGEQGPPGNDGAPGEKGDKGDTGERGEVGERGLQGEVGTNGIDGAPGERGEKGDPGERGEIGEKGDQGPDGPAAYVGEAKGLFDPAAEYRVRDVVALNGSAFMAKADNPGECPGEGWMLLAQRGKRGDKGDRGERGMDGKAGRDGADIVAMKFDAEKTEFVASLSNGETLEADFWPIANEIVHAVKALGD